MKTFLSLFFVLSFIFCFEDRLSGQSRTSSQMNSNLEYSNELRLNVFYALNGIIEVYYEYNIYDKNLSIGSSLGRAFSGFYDINFLASPYCKVYFSNKKSCQGFFLDPHLYIIHETGYSWPVDTNIGIGVGTNIGGKFIIKRRYILELSAGGGRFINEYRKAQLLYPRFSINLGYRF